MPVEIKLDGKTVQRSCKHPMTCGADCPECTKAMALIKEINERNLAERERRRDKYGRLTDEERTT